MELGLYYLDVGSIFEYIKFSAQFSLYKRSSFFNLVLRRTDIV